MKKILSALVATVVLSIIVSLVLIPGNGNSQKETEKMKTSSIPDSVYNILKVSCVSCHSKGGSNMAAMVLNLPGWDSYKAKKQAKLSASVCSEITEDKMPPKSFRKSKPEAIPTIEQKKIICSWAATFQETDNK